MFVICKNSFPSLVILIGWKLVGVRLNSNLIDSGLDLGEKYPLDQSSTRSATAASSGDSCLISLMIMSGVHLLVLSKFLALTLLVAIVALFSVAEASSRVMLVALQPWQLLAELR